MRNSGASAVVEGIGDHGCEYMTGGRVVILGRIGENFAAGMSGGAAYVLDSSNALKNINTAMVEVDDVTEAYAQELKALLEKHVALTGSIKAQKILHHFEQALPHFRLVIPTEYKRVLEKSDNPAG